jgi:transcriptional regulator with XRE-family HTH domain
MALSLKAQRRQRLREVLVSARKEAGLSQSAIAAKVGKPQAFVSRYESGERQIEVAELIELADALGVDAVTILRKVSKA